MLDGGVWLERSGRLPLVRNLDDAVALGVHPAAAVAGSLRDRCPAFVARDFSSDLGSSAACTGKARGATLRRDLIDLAARTTRPGPGHLTLHLPEGWHREHEWMTLFAAACGPPAAVA